MREALRRIFLEALRDLDLPRRIGARVSAAGSVLDIDGDLYALDQFRRIHVIAVGKAAAEMAATLDERIGRGRFGGLVIAGASPPLRLPNTRYILGGHPYPNAGSLEAAEQALALVRGCDEKSLVLYLISGGGSALMEKPLFDDISIEDAAEFNRVLVTCGANIYEMNVLRKHFSGVKGGRLAVAAHPARQATIYVSDVPPGKTSTVASGPTHPDESTVAECVEVSERYGLRPRLPLPYRRRLESAAVAAREIPETPKPGDLRFAHSRFCAVLSNADGVSALLHLARQSGWLAEADLSCDDWPLERAADYLLARLKQLRQKHGAPVCLVSGGELSCPVTGEGIGGRNLAFTLYCAIRIQGEDLAVLSGGTDGMDGNSPAAGAVADGTTVARARQLGADPSEALRRSDSYTFFAGLNDAIVTGPTGNNVRDLRVLVAA